MTARGHTLEDDFEDDDIPWASPEIRQRYEASLGAFMLAFNQVDHLLACVLETILRRLGRRDLVDGANGIAKKDFAFRVYVLDLLKSTPEGRGVSLICCQELRQLAKDRAILAHGHMDQNPFDGSYRLIWKGDDKGEGFTEERIDGLTSRARALWDALRYAEAFYVFDAVDVPTVD